MVQIETLNGSGAGRREVFCAFPCSIGRDSSADFQVEEQGVWDQHVEIHLDQQDTFSVHPRPEAPVEVNGIPVREAGLKSGDVIQLGFSKLLFRLSPTVQQNLRWRETATWCCLGLLLLFQISLIYWLVR